LILPDKSISSAKFKHAMIVAVPASEVAALKKADSRRASGKRKKFSARTKARGTSAVNSRNKDEEVRRGAKSHELPKTIAENKRQIKPKAKVKEVVVEKLVNIKKVAPRAPRTGTMSIDDYQRKMKWLFPSAGRFGSSRQH